MVVLNRWDPRRSVLGRLSEADPTWNQWDQDHWPFAYRSDSDGTKSELVQAQQSTPHYLCQLKTVGSGEVHVV